MQTLFRLTLLGIFASIGIALALVVVVQFEAPDEESAAVSPSEFSAQDARLGTSSQEDERAVSPQ